MEMVACTSINYLSLIIDYYVCEQLHVHSVSSSVRQELVSMVTVSVTVWSTVLMLLMKLIVVSRSGEAYLPGLKLVSCLYFTCRAGEADQ